MLASDPTHSVFRLHYSTHVDPESFQFTAALAVAAATELVLGTPTAEQQLLAEAVTAMHLGGSSTVINWVPDQVACARPLRATAALPAVKAGTKVLLANPFDDSGMSHVCGVFLVFFF
jgi:hypothetical protein